MNQIGLSCLARPSKYSLARSNWVKSGYAVLTTLQMPTAAGCAMLEW